MFEARTFAFSILMTFSLAIGAPVQAQAPDRQAQMVEMAAWADLLTHYDTLYRLSEELVFWQSVATLGGIYDWTFDYNTSGTEQLSYTYRLRNSTEESQVEAIRALQAIQRSLVAEASQVEHGEALHAGYIELRNLSVQILDLLLAEEPGAAAELFESETVPLRRNLASQAYSASREIRVILRDMGLNARLGR